MELYGACFIKRAGTPFAFHLKAVPASVISVATALVFPVILIGVLWPLGLTGIWLNLAGTSVLAAILSAGILLKYRAELSGPDTQ